MAEPLVATRQGSLWHLRSTNRLMTRCGYVIMVGREPRELKVCSKCVEFAERDTAEGRVFDADPERHHEAECGGCAHLLTDHRVSKGRQYRRNCLRPGCACKFAKMPNGAVISEWEVWVAIDLLRRRRDTRKTWARVYRAPSGSAPVSACCEGELLGLEGEHSADCPQVEG